MEKSFKEQNYWALILGGSSGFGLASAKKLSSHGMNIFIVHRDRKGSMERIEKEFAIIKESGVGFESMNIDALSPEGQASIIQKLKLVLAETGKIRLLLHSIAFGNLKLLVPEKKEISKTHPLEILSQRLDTSFDKVKEVTNSLFSEGYDEFMHLANQPAYNNEVFLEDEDIANTIYSMGTSIITWTKKVFQAGLFDEHARILGLTSEGNEVAWKGYAAVSAAKLALESACRSIAYEMGGYGIRANVLQPGVTDTPALRLIPGSSHMLAHARLRNPSGRLTTPEDVANVVYLMTLDESYWINGEIIRVDGGERIAG
jgi:NAD(P)-dependent dehydrogenase (short-subunit alcohol dehydrogenase family)